MSLFPAGPQNVTKAPQPGAFFIFLNTRGCKIPVEHQSVSFKIDWELYPWTKDFNWCWVEGQRRKWRL